MLTHETAFDEMIDRLRIPEQYWSEHPEIVDFARRHYRSRYVPPDLLTSLGLSAEPMVSDWQDLTDAKKRTRLRKKQRQKEGARTSINTYLRGGVWK